MTDLSERKKDMLQAVAVAMAAPIATALVTWAIEEAKKFLASKRGPQPDDEPKE